jgi:hypothetical protein
MLVLRNKLLIDLYLRNKNNYFLLCIFLCYLIFFHALHLESEIK